MSVSRATSGVQSDSRGLPAGVSGWLAAHAAYSGSSSCASISLDDDGSPWSRTRSFRHE
jgi:hypothetical protein